MSRGTFSSHYSSRNLDACTLHLSNWSPFVPNLPPDDDFASHPSLLLADQPSSLDFDTNRSTSRESSAVPPVTSPWNQILSTSAGNDRCRWSLKDLSTSLDSEYKFQTKKLRRTPAVGTDNRCFESGLSYAQTGEYVPMSLDDHAHGATGCTTDPSMLNHQCAGVEGRDCSEISMLTTSLSGWSKRQKQFSQALARGLWRWKESTQARKKRRKGGSSRSGSGRSSDSRRARMYASDPPTVVASAPYATCSDIPIPGTDSSGELFFCGECGGVGWDSEVSLVGETNMQKRDGLDVFHAWIMSETQSIESGYGSEPGYRGDGEIGYEDDGNPDEQDEEERQQFRLSPWRESSSCKITPSARGSFDKLGGENILMGDPTSSSETKVQHRLRRRRQDFRSLAGQKNRNPW